MDAKSNLRTFNISFAISSSSNSPETEKSSQDYTEDFYSSSQSKYLDISSKLLEISTSLSGSDATTDECISKFVGKKLQILKGNSIKKASNTSEDPSGCENRKELDPFWLKKFKILHQNDIAYQKQKHNGFDKDLYYKSHSNSNCNSSSGASASKSTREKVNEIGAFQRAYEELKFQNLRSRCKKLIESQILSPGSAMKNQETQEDLLKSEFYKNCLRKLQQKKVEEKFSEHIQTKSSALLIARIIEDGPKPSWTKDKIWKKLFSGGYNNVKSEQH